MFLTCFSLPIRCLVSVFPRACLCDAVGYELVLLRTDDNGEDNVYKVFPFENVCHEGNNYTFVLNYKPVDADAYICCVRMYPKNAELTHLQDFCYLRWL